jgi:hypothetical protein
MHTVFAFERIAIIVGPWWEPGAPPEYGTRVEVRLLAAEPHRGTPSAAQRVVVDTPLWRADLFDQVGAPAGNLLAAHFHPCFKGVEPCSREWPDALRADSLGWLSDQLGDLATLHSRSRPDDVGDDALERDADGVRAALPEILAAVDRTWVATRAEPGSLGVRPA